MFAYFFQLKIPTALIIVVQSTFEPLYIYRRRAIRDAVAAVSDGLPGSLFQGNLVEALAKALVTALETRDKKVVEPSIEVTQKLITSGMIRGEVTRLHAPNLQASAVVIILDALVLTKRFFFCVRGW